MIDEIKKLEEELRLAMLISDVSKLSRLIADELIFTLPNGEIATKEIDLDAHRSGLQKLTCLECVSQNIREFSTFAVVASKMKLEGTFDQNKIDGEYGYTRVWAKMGNDYQVVAGQVAFIKH